MSFHYLYDWTLKGIKLNWDLLKRENARMIRKVWVKTSLKSLIRSLVRFNCNEGVDKTMKAEILTVLIASRYVGVISLDQACQKEKEATLENFVGLPFAGFPMPGFKWPSDDKSDFYTTVYHGSRGWNQFRMITGIFKIAPISPLRTWCESWYFSLGF